MTLSAGTRLGPYEILAPLGAGGMGEVYRARDKKLDRDVAIKVLPQSVAADPDTLSRFEREAKAVAALSHPNILSIFDFGAQGAISYAVMELLEGETLRGKLDAGPITQKQAVDYALQMAKGLSAAHEKGIVHRDLKPENLFVSRDGHVKILDFGLAKRVEAVAPGKETSAPTGSGHTEPGTVMGTAGYMSPEQVKGLPVDHRSDIFSFGTILYELLSGKRAFKRETSAETMAAILRDEPPELSESGRNISPALDRLVKHCLEKDRDHRFQSARDIAFNLLEQLSPAVTSGAREIAPPISSAGFWVAVLPFKSSGDAEMESFADGLGEEITTGLSRFRYLSVVASASAVRLKGEAGDERALGAKLGARYVLEGSIRKGGSAIRVSAQLIDAQAGARLWAETYNRDLQTSSIFAVQDDVAARIVATVADSYGVLVHSIRSAIRQKDDVDLTPAEWQFQYFAYREQITPSAYAALKSRLERAVERDKRQSDLWACLAQIYLDEYAFGFPGGDATSLDRALAAARRGVELDRANQFALVALAQTHFFRQDIAAFGPAAERAMALNPLNTDALGILGLQIVHTGEFERGTAIVRRAMELNANHAGWMHFAPLWDHFHKEEYEQALECANRVDVPGLFWPYLVMASACGQLGRHAEAQAAVRDLLALDPEFAAHARANIGTWHFASGLMEPLLEGLRKAGLSIPAADQPSDPRRKGTVTAKAARADSDTDSGQVRAEEGFWVAVLPFKSSGSNPELAGLAEGLTDDIVTGLSRFSYLRVIARSSTAHLVNETVDVRSAGEELGARYVMEGSLRQAGTKVRLAVQLVDATTGAHLWAENYERTFNPEAVFELQDDLVPRIVSTCADRFGVLARSISDAVRGGDPGQLGPYEALMRGFGYHHRLTPVEHAEAREALERAVGRAPSNANCWAMLSWIYSHEHAHGFNVRPGSLERALEAARRAVDIAPSNQLAQQALAVVLFFRKETAGCLSAAERAIALNPLDTSNEAMFLITFIGDWDRGCALIRRAMELNPHHPRWYGVVLGINEYRLANYRAAVDEAVKANAPEVFWTNLLLAAAHGQLGDLTAARNALRDLLAQKEDFAQSAGELLGKWFDPQLVGHLTEGLRKAGLEIAPEKRVVESSKPSAPISGAVSGDEGFWVAVLPFKYSGADAALTALAEGLTEDIVTGLSRFSYLRVIARGSTAQSKNEAVDARSAGKELGARYIMEGSLRQAGTKLRLAVQLVDAVSGAHLWAENYERSFSPEAVFELQDDLVPRIVSTVADQYGALVHSMSESLRGRSAGEYSAHEAVLRAFGYWERMTLEEHAEVREILEAAVAHAPGHSDCLAELSLIYWAEYAFGYNLRPDPLGRARAASQRAVASAPTSHFAHSALATALFFQKDFLAFRPAAERALALNRMDSSTAAILGTMIACAGDWEYGLDVVERAKQLNPHHPGWYHYLAFDDAYHRRDYRGALAIALKVNMPGYHWPHVYLAAVYGQLGEQQRARAALRELHALVPNFGAVAREEFGKWFDAELTEHLLDGLRKAGLDVPAPARADPAAKANAAIAIAVLPFSDMSPAKDQEYLCEGMAEEIMNSLVRIDGIRVASRTSAFRARQDGSDLPSIARALSVNHVLEGSVRTAGDRLRVTAQLTDVASGFQLWSERYDREASDVFAVQDEIAAGVVEAVKARLATGARAIQPRPQVKNLDAYRHYLQGRHFRYTKNDHASALRAYEQAVALDPTHAPSWVGLAEVSILAAFYALIPTSAAYARAKGALATAAQLQGESAEALYVEGFMAFAQRNWEAWERAQRRAIELDPSHVQVRGIYGIFLSARHRLDEAMVSFQRARELDPLAPFPYAITGLGLLASRRVEESIPYFDDALSFDRENSLALWASGMANVALGRHETGIALLERAATQTRRGGYVLGILGWALATAGRAEQGRAILAELRARPDPAPTVVSEAWLLAALGDADGAFDLLARAEDEQQPYLSFTGLPGFDSLRADPRFGALLERLGLSA